MSINDIFAALKESLTKALSLYYPLADRLAPDESSINCNNEGMPFVEARCDCTLSAFLHALNRVEFLWRFVPSIISRLPLIFIRKLLPELVPLAVQVTVFKCGGVLIGTKGIHKILYATSCGSFLKCWSDFARGHQVVSKPEFASSVSLFPPCTWAAISPPREPIPLWILDGNKMDGTGWIVKVFHFSRDSISILQAKAKSHRLLNPTRLEAVSGFVWKHAMVAAATSKNQRFFVLEDFLSNIQRIWPGKAIRSSRMAMPIPFSTSFQHSCPPSQGQE